MTIVSAVVIVSAAVIVTAAPIAVPSTGMTSGPSAGTALTAVAGVPRAVVRQCFFRRPAFQHSLAGKAYFPVFVDCSDHHCEFITHMREIFHLFTRSLSSCEMCTMPSMPGRISTKAPKSAVRTTLPV